MKKNISIQNLGEAKEFFKSLASNLKPKDILCLTGNLGTGKTTYARMIIDTLIKEDIDVTSPTFNLVHTYKAKAGMIWHFDLYRLKNEEEVLELGIEDAFAYGISIIEWPEIIDHLIPETAINIAIEFGESENERILTITSSQNLDL